LPVDVYAAAVDANRVDFPNRDQCAMTLRFANGSVGTITYVARGDTRLAKEYFEVFAGGMSAVLDDFRKLTLYSGGHERVLWRGAQDKGHSAEVAEFLRATRDKKAPISLGELRAVTLATFAAEESLRSGMPAAIG
jgi:polar amino acid transport system substrate-binding protein